MLVLLVFLKMSMRHEPRPISGAYPPYMCCRLFVWLWWWWWVQAVRIVSKVLEEKGSIQSARNT